MDAKDARANLIKYMAGKYKVDLTNEDVFRFSVLGPFGVPMNQMKQYIESNESQRKDMNQQTQGLPIDTTKVDELADWVHFGLIAALDDYNAKKSAGQNVKPPRFAIKADGRAKYKVVKQVIDICQKQNVQHFDLITSLKVKEQE